MLYLVILILNILFIYFVKSDKKYWLVSIPLWIILILAFIFWRTNSDRQIQNFEIEYNKTFQGKEYGDFAIWNKLGDQKKTAQKLNLTFVYLIGLQTFITFILQTIGHKLTRQKTYKWTKVVFGILFALVFLIFVMMGVVTSGRIIG